MKFSTKQITTWIISTLIMLMLFTIFVLFFNDKQDGTVSYLIDDINTCSWEGDVITSSTEAFGTLRVQQVDIANESEFISLARANGECVAKLGGSSGSYEDRLNAQYRNRE